MQAKIIFRVLSPCMIRFHGYVVMLKEYVFLLAMLGYGWSLESMNENNSTVFNSFIFFNLLQSIPYDQSPLL